MHQQDLMCSISQRRQGIQVVSAFTADSGVSYVSAKGLLEYVNSKAKQKETMHAFDQTMNSYKLRQGRLTATQRGLLLVSYC